MSEFIGPALPPDLQNEVIEEEEQEDNVAVGPVLPSLQDRETECASDVSYGPSLPPNLAQEEEEEEEVKKNVIGPSLPAYLPTIQPDEEEEGKNEEHEEDIIGPLPPSQGSELTAAQRLRDIDRRSRKMKERLTANTSGKDEPQREEWMLELPPEIKAFGLGARKFKTAYVDTGDRSVWTDTPHDRQKKAQETVKTAPSKSKSDDDQVTVARDVRMKKQVEEYNKLHRPESLMELHRKRKAAEEPEVKERRPFDRERDLEIPRHLVTASKRQALAKDSAKSLDSKFTHGKQSYM